MASDLTVAFQPPLREALCALDRTKPAASQTTLPQTLLDALTVRETVFVNELYAVSLNHHTDRDDARACHWVLYSASHPIGTIRLIPSPHSSHPLPSDHFLPPGPDVPPQTSESVFLAELPAWKEDRATSFHDGRELYVKLGRLAVVKEERGGRRADLLIQAALKWAGENPGLCKGEGEGGEWKGLVCVHARREAKTTWERNGFVVDEEMGTWMEVGGNMVGMFCRVEIDGRE